MAALPAAMAAGVEIFASFVDNSDRYLPGLQTLAASLAAHNNTRPFVVFTDGRPSDGLLQTAACLNFSLLHTWGHDNPQKGTRFADTYSKLQAFSINASRVVLLDVDMVVLGNLDGLFRPGPMLQAVPDVDTRMTFNSGLLVIEPSLELQALVAEFLSHTLVSQRQMDDGTEQGFLNRMFINYWLLTPAARLSMQFNTVKRLETNPSWYWRKFDLRWIRILHFVGDKPWQTNADNDNVNYPQSYGAYKAALRAFQEKCGNTWFPTLCASPGPVTGSAQPHAC
eukprot:TRINITY_DN62967_c0_g1_i1.p1 TRINITY_DN62967_c0_g1~~TRINITY_DN62967_c0_g1_i1.p1  ORF type:complete len:295 (-),score=32.53 TRINITY_DN62967_c0_g1_i1:32-877(-)